MTFDPAFIGLLGQALGEDRVPAVISALSAPASVSVRLNPFKVSDKGGPGVTRDADGDVPWCRYGVFLPERPVFTLDPVFHSGAYYVQDSSAMYPGYVFRQALAKRLEEGRSGPLRVLDLCAAPGGKTTDMASSLRAELGNDFLLVANEVMKQRAAVLADNVGIWGDPCVVVTSADPSAFSGMKGFFDIILADVPCSGEGMFRKDEEAVSQWSRDNVMMCQARQRRIIADVWPALAEGGMLVYSTCTFNREENDLNVLWSRDSLGAEVMELEAEFPGLIRTEAGISLAPGFVRGEGQYCALLRKVSGDVASRGKIASRNAKGSLWGQAPAAVRALCSDILSAELLEKEGLVIAVPGEITGLLSELEWLHPLQRGTTVGRMKGRDLVPDEDLALSLLYRRGSGDFALEAEIPLKTALAYLHGDAVVLDNAEKGLVMLTYEGFPLGFVKNIGSRCNSLHPKGRRIRMDVR